MDLEKKFYKAFIAPHQALVPTAKNQILESMSGPAIFPKFTPAFPHGEALFLRPQYPLSFLPPARPHARGFKKRHLS
ncbi:hypothetical protein PgNI_11443 [Pyricularia grisea]|uniref:Uncharacterized protein n=1 Tax=Pyricularia grisea TaxID=148305 RepID=A0A6P8APP7_PYRGI|nr:hypothetical protein PgNI_11443 [Pyricularia grisea]TLD03997.1 hypothetical protein PgNI_11443 [Pyricularia grisea]